MNCLESCWSTGTDPLAGHRNFGKRGPATSNRKNGFTQHRQHSSSICCIQRMFFTKLAIPFRRPFLPNHLRAHFRTSPQTFREPTKNLPLKPAPHLQPFPELYHQSGAAIRAPPDWLTWLIRCLAGTEFCALMNCLVEHTAFTADAAHTACYMFKNIGNFGVMSDLLFNNTGHFLKLWQYQYIDV